MNSSRKNKAFDKINWSPEIFFIFYFSWMNEIAIEKEQLNNNNNKPTFQILSKSSIQHLLDPSIKPGLNLNMRMQNSIWLRAPSPSRSPSISIKTISSSPMSFNPSRKLFLFKLSNVMSPFSQSISKRNPLQSSPINPSAPNLAIMDGK